MNQQSRRRHKSLWNVVIVFRFREDTWQTSHVSLFVFRDTQSAEAESYAFSADINQLLSLSKSIMRLYFYFR